MHAAETDELPQLMAEQGLGTKHGLMRLWKDAGLSARPTVSSLFRRTKLHALMNHFWFVFLFFFLSLRKLAKGSRHVEQSQQATLFPVMFLCPLEAKAIPLLMAWVAPRVPLLPSAPSVLMWCRIDSSAHFPVENLVFSSAVEMSPDHWPCVHPDSY